MSYAEAYLKLREKFPPEQIGKLPATQKRPALDFVGHAAVTDRLNRVVPDDWTYMIHERFVVDGSCWLFGTFTIGGVSRQEYGDGKDPKEAIGNFIRRGAMRFGVAIDLWSREELEASGELEPGSTVAGSPQASGMGEPTSGEANTGASSDGAAYGEGVAPDGAGEARRGASVPDKSSPVSPEQEQAAVYIRALREGPGNTQAVLQARALFETETRKVKNLLSLSVDELFDVMHAFEDKREDVSA
jgi:hypothetical protein